MLRKATMICSGTCLVAALGLTTAVAQFQEKSDFERGKALYTSLCQRCHGPDGDAISYPGVVPVVGVERRLDEAEIVRTVSALALLRMGEKGVKKLRFGLDSSRKEVVAAATHALAHLTDVDGLVIEDLMDALRRTRSAAPAAEALAKMGKKAVPALVEGLSSKRERVRTWCCYALGKMSADAKEAVPALEKLAAEDSSPAVRDAADRALHWIRTG